MQWQQICQNICGCYGDWYKELTAERDRENGRKREEEITQEEKNRQTVNLRDLASRDKRSGGILGQVDDVMFLERGRGRCYGGKEVGK